MLLENIPNDKGLECQFLTPKMWGMHCQPSLKGLGGVGVEMSELILIYQDHK